MYSNVAYFSRVMIDELGYPIDTKVEINRTYRRQTFPEYVPSTLFPHEKELKQLTAPYADRQLAKQLSCKFFPTSKMWRCEINNFLARAMWGIGTKCFPYPTVYNEKRVKSHGWILNPQKDPNAIRRTQVNGRFYSHIVDWMEYDMKRQQPQQPSQKRQKLERLYFDGSK